eukprot:14132386-Alexandrium_andersonii.AAC.1
MASGTGRRRVFVLGDPHPPKRTTGSRSEAAGSCCALLAALLRMCWCVLGARRSRKDILRAAPEGPQRRVLSGSSRFQWVPAVSSCFEQSP